MEQPVVSLRQGLPKRPVVECVHASLPVERPQRVQGACPLAAAELLLHSHLVGLFETAQGSSSSVSCSGRTESKGESKRVVVLV